MKMIQAIIRPEAVGRVKEELEKNGFKGLTLIEVRGRGRQGGVTWKIKGSEYKVELLSKVKIEIVVRDEDTQRVATIIADNAYTGEVGDGKIFIIPVEEAIRVRTKEKGVSAI